MEDRSRQVPAAAAQGRRGRLFLDAVAEKVLVFSVFVLLFVWWLLRWTAAALVIIAVMAGAGYYVFNTAVAGGQYVTVPNLVGQPITKATWQLAELDLESGKPKHVTSERVPEFHVLAQNPAAGSVVRAGRSVSLFISVGPDFAKVGDLVGLAREKALDKIRGAGLQEGTIARIPHSEARGTVIAQDPAPGAPVSSGGAVHLLLSSGRGGEQILMPTLVGKPVQDVLTFLDAQGLLGVEEKSFGPGSYNVVLDQYPAPGTVVRAGDAVHYYVRRADQAATHEARVVYVVPQSWFKRQVRVDSIDADGRRETRFPLPEHYVDNAPPEFESGDKIEIRVEYEDEITVEVYLDGQKARSYYFSGGSEPAIMDHTGFPEGENSAETEDSTLYLGQ